VSKSRGPGAAISDDERDARLREILRRLRKAPGDKPAWGALHELMWPRVFGQALNEFEANVKDANEVTDEVFARLAHEPRGDVLLEPSRLRAYLDDLLRTVIADVRHGEAARRAAARHLLGRVEDASWWRELLALEEIWQTLTPEDRHLLKRRHVDGATYTELAAERHVSQSTASRHVSKAERRLRRNFGLLPEGPLT
jgi:RNA polymerase sigma factor (sigma-70 family)